MGKARKKGEKEYRTRNVECQSESGGKYDPAHRWRVKREKFPPAQGWVKRKSIPCVCTPAQRTGLNTTTVGASGRGGRGFRIYDMRFHIGR